MPQRDIQIVFTRLWTTLEELGWTPLQVRVAAIEYVANSTMKESKPSILIAGAIDQFAHDYAGPFF